MSVFTDKFEKSLNCLKMSNTLKIWSKLLYSKSRKPSSLIYDIYIYMIFDVLYCIISCPSWWTRACPSYQPFLLCKQLLSHDLKCFPFSVNAIHYIAHWIPKRSKIHVHHVWGFPAKTTDCVFQAGSKIAILHNWKTNFGGRRWTRNAVTQLQVE